ncbi:hypothetical protein DAPPUDRAFT_249610 [Daphnia pulex]|uniref:Uncharacterized protein n=1 Tax=Daphnia pulex TaxID=6669 RepID=E9GX02_DAPPU|nr:hypothetical protein DAPPUDRAFT_249610 [Daphnia pulex]|eukprot:EFX76021.1 hypothetical protein DAPPUDRAFT_249610 [Daphnia pulex]
MEQNLNNQWFRDFSWLELTSNTVGLKAKVTATQTLSTTYYPWVACAKDVLKIFWCIHHEFEIVCVVSLSLIIFAIVQRPPKSLIVILTAEQIGIGLSVHPHGTLHLS